MLICVWGQSCDSHVMGSDVVSLAFQWDCDEFLQRVFLELDPYSLKTSRKVDIKYYDSSKISF